MRPVVVRFAGDPDPVVRRRAIQLGGNIKQGKRSSFVLQGYVVTLVGEASRTIATAVELGLQLAALWGVAMDYEQQNSGIEQWTLPTARLRRVTNRIPPSPVPQVGERGRRAIPELSLKFIRSKFVDVETSRRINRTILPASAQLGTPSGRVSAKVDVGRYGVTHAWVAAALVVDEAQYLSTVEPWVINFEGLQGALSVNHWSSIGSWAAVLQDDWVSRALGVDLLFVGAASRRWSRIEYDAPWLIVGPTPTPWMIEDEGLGDLNHEVSRECKWAYRQNCVVGVAVAEPAEGQRPDGQFVVVAPMARMEDSLFVLRGGLPTPGGGESEGYISTHSVAAGALFEAGGFLTSAPWHPELVVMSFGSSPVTEVEVERWAEYTSATAPLGRYPSRRTGSREDAYLISPPNGAPNQVLIPDPEKAPPLGAQAPTWLGGRRVTTQDLPLWLRPGTVAARSDHVRQALVNSAMGDFSLVLPRIDSDNPLPAAFGATYSTVVNGVAEFAVSFKALDSALLDVGASRRAISDVPAGVATQAAVAVAKTGLVFVTVPIGNPAGLTVSTAFHDVVGPADCPQFRAGMDPNIAYLPQVRFACVLGGARTYAVRAVRYQRSPFLASMLSSAGVNTPVGYTPSYAGRESFRGGPVFYTDREFGPYPDRAKYEELWFIVDGTKYVVDTSALGGNIEPYVGAKYVNAVAGAPHAPIPPGMSVRRECGMFSEEDMEDMELLDFSAEEFVCPGSETHTFAQVSDTDVMFVLSQRVRVGARTDFNSVVCRFSVTTGQATVVTTLPGTRQQLDRFCALTCYQFEVVVDGQVEHEPCLVLRRGSGLSGDVWVSTDGGVTWALLYDETSTVVKSATGADLNSQGTPSHGLHVIRRCGRRTDPRYTIYPQTT